MVSCHDFYQFSAHPTVLNSADLHSAANGNIEIDILTHVSYLAARGQQRCGENMPIMSSSEV